ARSKPTATRCCRRRSTCAGSCARSRGASRSTPWPSPTATLRACGSPPLSCADGPDRDPRARASARARLDLRRRRLRGRPGADRAREGRSVRPVAPRDRARARVLPAPRRAERGGAREAVRVRARRRAGLRPPAGADAHLVSFAHRVPPELAGKRLDAALAALEPALSRAQVKRLIDEGRVTVAGAVVKPAHKVKSGEEIA